MASACGLDDSWPENVKHGLPPTKEYLDMAADTLGNVLYDKGDFTGAKACAELWVKIYKGQIHNPPPTRALELLGKADEALGSAGGAGAVNSNPTLGAPTAALIRLVHRGIARAAPCSLPDACT